MTTRTVILTDQSIASLSGSSQTLLNADMTRSFIMIENTGNANIGVNPTGGTAAIGGTGTFTIVANGSMTFETGSIPGNKFTVIGTAGQPVACVTSP